MRRRVVAFDFVTVTTALSLSSTVGAVWVGLQVHCLVLKYGFGLDTVVGNSVLTMYMRVGSVGDAQKVFDEMLLSQRDLVSWNALVTGYAQNPRHRFETVRVFRKMMELSDELSHVDHVAFSSVLAVCGNENWVHSGEQVHGLAVKFGIESQPLVSNMLMSAYLRFGMLPAVRRTFEKMTSRDVVSWTTMISVDPNTSFMYFNEMRRSDVSPNEITFVALSSAVETMMEGQGVHGLCCILGFLTDNCVGNSLITMYYSVGASMVDARKVFDEMGEESRDSLSWNALISGYAQTNNSSTAVATFSDMLVKQKPDEYTFGTIIGLISRATSTSPLTHGQQCHCHVIKSSLIIFHHVSSALIDMYSRHGHLTSSEKLFSVESTKSLMSWTSILSAHSLHGNHGRVMGLFHEMVGIGLEPDPITYLTVLTACSRTGNVETGFSIFRSMKLDPWREHYTTMVDMLARAGRLEEAEDLMLRMPMGPNVSTLQSLLGGCRVQGNAEVGQRMVDALVDIDSTQTGAYVLLSNIYAEKGEWEKVANMRKSMRNIGVKKEVGFSWVVDNLGGGGGGGDFIHRFSSDDTCHRRSDEIYKIVECLAFEMKIKQNSELTKSTAKLEFFS